MANVKRYEFIAQTACRAVVREYADFGNGEPGKVEIWSLHVPVSNLPRGLPFGPNARNADLKSSRPAKKMLSTLADEPSRFVLYNSGIMIVAKGLKAMRLPGGDFSVEMELEVPDSKDEDDLGHGVLNGGHTYKAIMYALYGNHSSRRQANFGSVSEASVQVSIATGIPEEEIPRISEARNLSKSVPTYALKNLKHDWKPIRQHLPKNCLENVAFKPNDEGVFEESEYNVTDLIRRLALLNNRLFPWRKDKHPMKAYNGLGSLVSSWKEEDYAEVLPLLPDILRLEEKIMEGHALARENDIVHLGKVKGCSTKKPTKLITGREFDFSIGEIFYMPILAAFRVFLKEGSWIQDVDELWDQYGYSLVERLWTSYMSEGRSNPSFFAKSTSTWQTLVHVVMIGLMPV